MAKLERYNQKRNFENTNEPQANPKKKASKKPSFTVQRHHASRLHYDFRLEVDGVLKSWAVPKGPSLNPKDRRLAVQVEDHPLSYGSFEGAIPKGNYGAGTVTIFDSGTFDYEESKNEKEFLSQWKEGSIKFTLHGKILQGGFALVRMKTDEPDNWLLIKHKDDYAVDKAFDAEELIAPIIKKEGIDFKEKKVAKKNAAANTKKASNPEELRPMLAKLSSSLPSDSGWIFEQKYDGFRALAVIENGNIKIVSRNNKSLNVKFPSLRKELEALKRDAVLDGEIVIEDKNGKSYFQLLQSGEPIAKNLRLCYYVFDLLRLDGNDLRDFPLSERKELLKLFLKKASLKLTIYVKSLSMKSNKLMDHAKKMGWEGVIAKTNDSPYLAGKRGDFWQKIKGRNTQEAIICGYTAPQGSRAHFGALVLGIMNGGRLIYIGNCGTGFNDAAIKDLHSKMIKLVRRTKPLSKGVKVAKESQVTWLAPKLTCEVYYAEWTSDKHLRHPVFKVLREDKSPENTQIELHQTINNMEKERNITYGRKTVSLTNQNKIYWPHGDIKKGDMLAYYETVATHILPYLKDKPISMNRFPNGINGQSFFQKDVAPDQLPSWIKTTKVHSESGNKMIDYMLCNDEASLLFIANLGSIEINPWLASYKKPEKPQFAVLDLDPNGAEFDEVIAVALSTHKILEKANVPAFIKTSGSSGLHIYMNVNQKYDFEIVRDFVQLIAEMVNQQHPDTTSLVRDPKKRKKLIYLDYLQNKKGQTIVAPYSVRPKPGATVSAPLGWKEINKTLRIADHDIFTMPERIKNVTDPWKKIWESPVNIKKALSFLS
ncbi:DNA ligase D [Sphingobacterium sp. JB170]|uniref:DNA ligase D n=1 Tax=Sphingobacterium sp. JB170 TaxID=1434842 RepID=UPI00097F1ACC|nr:DNA ligase D [Sphingobacterium sp. JB170]SJN47548.1 ATP-dependent DNA ligase clustered with Ku protein, LigD [Sphingobacterium sp. JB170]